MIPRIRGDPNQNKRDCGLELVYLQRKIIVIKIDTSEKR